MTPDLGPIGIWAPSSTFTRDGGDGRRVDDGEAAAELDELGYGTVWLGSSDPSLRMHETLLRASSRLVVASGIVNTWQAPPEDVAGAYHRVDAVAPGRFVLGLGPSHGPLVEALGKAYRKPLAQVTAFVDALDALPAGATVPADRRILAALGPRALALAAARFAGAHPYLVFPEQTADARAALGDGPLLAPEQKVVLDTDPSSARATARAHLTYYLRLPNYTNNFRRAGFTDADLNAGGSDRLIDALYAWGDEEAAARRVAEHRAAGADHVAVQVVQAGGEVGGPAPGPPRDEWRRLAPALLAAVG
jgi:probable F420-dependent oxidoreductase